ncbi:unnamed protein product [Rhizophagus irregularis]|nr:unnamed protein product [Rhizophagus irregularis]
MTHVFQTLEHPSTTKSYERTSEFINRVLNWEEIGIVPSITRNEFNSTSHRLTPKLLISIGCEVVGTRSDSKTIWDYKPYNKT